MNFGKSPVFCLGIAAALWAFPKAGSAETLNTLAAPPAGSSADLSTWFGWDARDEGFLIMQSTMYDFVGAPEVNATKFDGKWLGIAWDEWDKLDRLLPPSEIFGWSSSAPIPESVITDAVPPKVPEPKPWVLVACGVSFLAASAGLRRRPRTMR
jgi:hypothetical protein